MIAATLGSRTVEVPQIQFIARVSDIPVRREAGTHSANCGSFQAVVAMAGFLALFAPFFALLRLSGVERQVSVEEPSTTKSSSSSRAGGVALTPGVSPRCQATSRA